MPASEAQILANRRNAAKSSGPRTEAGKARSRLNAVRHGLRAEATVLPGEDVSQVASRFVHLHEQLRPATDLGEAWVDQVAYQLTRLERCQRFDRAHYETRMNEACEAFDARVVERFGVLADRLEAGDPSARPELEAMPEGVAWLLLEWAELREGLDPAVEAAGPWGPKDAERARVLLGLPASDREATRLRGLAEVVAGTSGDAEGPGAPVGLDSAGMVARARGELLRVVDSEVARLTAARSAIDPAIREKERRSALDLALFDPSREATLARRYEAMTLRALEKAIDRLHQAEATTDGPVERAGSAESGTTCEESGSFGAEAEPPAEESEEDAESVAPPPTVPSKLTPKRSDRIVRTPEERKKRPDPAKSRRK